MGFAQHVLMHQMSLIQIVVPYPGLTISVNQDINFGKLASNSGKVVVKKEGANAGRFTLTGVYHLLPIYMWIQAPRMLFGETDSIGYMAKASYNDLSNNVSTSSDIPTSGDNVVTMTLQANQEGWTGFAYVYLFGSVDVGNVPSGVYTGTVEITLVM